MKKRIVTLVIVVIVIVGLLLTARTLANQLNLVELIRSLHGG